MSDLNKAQAQLDEKEKELAEVMAIFDAAMKEKQVRYNVVPSTPRLSGIRTHNISGDRN
jgi:hypothetical protein